MNNKHNSSSPDQAQIEEFINITNNLINKAFNFSDKILILTRLLLAKIQVLILRVSQERRYLWSLANC